MASDLGDKLLFLRVGGGEISLEGKILIFSEITLSLGNLYF